MNRTPKDICLLCGKNHSDKKGSHMIPAFLTSSALNHGGVKDRDKELMFMLRKGGFSETYIGRSVLPDAIGEFKGRELTNEEIEANSNPNVKDYFFCSECEKKLGVVESCFATEVHDKLLANKLPLEPSKRNYSTTEIPSPISALSRLFFLTVLWRTSIAKISALRLSEDAERKLKNAINDCLDNDTEVMLEKCKKHFERLSKFPLIVLFSERPTDSTRGIIYADKHRLPHFLIANQYTLLFYEKERQFKSPPNTFFGLTDNIDKKELVNLNEQELIIGVFSEKQSEDFRKEVLKMMVDETRSEIRILFSKVHEMAYGFRPTEDVVYALTHKIVHGDSSLADRYGYENIQKNIVDFMMDRQDYFLQQGSFPRYQIGDKKPDL